MITELKPKYYKEAAKVYLNNYECNVGGLEKVKSYMKLKGTHLVALEKGEVIGMIVAPNSNMNPNITEISYLAVKKDQRGKGIGTKLINELKKRVTKKSKRTILTYSRSAVDFYKKQGFRIVAEDEVGKYLFKRLHPK